MPSDLVAILDMDGTLFDYEGQLREDLEKLMSPEEVMPDNIFDESIPWIKARMHLIKSQPGWWRDLPKFKLGWDVYEIAVELGFCIDILTKGPRSKPQAWAEKVECIMMHFGEEVVPNIVGKTKKRYYGSFLCDDYPPYITDWLEHRPRGLVIMPAHKYNEDFTHPRVIRYDGSNLDEVRRALSIVAVRKAGEELVLDQTLTQNSVLWGKGWYAIKNEEEEDDRVTWYFAPIEFYDKHNHLPDGLEFVPDDQMTEEVEKADNGDVAVNLPNGFEPCMEGAAGYHGDGDPEEILKEAGFVLTNIRW